MLVRGEPFRAKFRNSFEHPEALTPGKVTDIDYTMQDVNHTFRKGHRIMIQIQSSWFPLTDRNPQVFVDFLKAKPEDGLGWKEAKGFAQAVCTEMANDSPDRYVLNMAKRHRTGRIFLDYLRNDRISTAVAPLSPRARAGAPVSMPLTWKALREGLEPKRFTLATAPSLLRKGKAWADYDAAEQPLAHAIAMLVKDPRR